MKYNIETRIKDNSLVYLTDFQNAEDLYLESLEDWEDREDDNDFEALRRAHESLTLAFEVLFGAAVLGFGGEFESEHREVRRLLKAREYTAGISNEKYENKMKIDKTEKEKKLMLEKISEFMAKGYTYTEISRQLGISVSAIKYRVNSVMKTQYPELYEKVICARSEKSEKSERSENWSEKNQTESEKSEMSETWSEKFEPRSEKSEIWSEKSEKSEKSNEGGLSLSNDKDNVKDKEKEKEKSTPLASSNQLIAQQPTSLPIPDNFTLRDYRQEFVDKCKSLPDYKQNILRVALSRLPYELQTNDCWLYYALSKLNLSDDMSKQAARLTIPGFQEEVWEMVHEEQTKLEQRIHQRAEIEASMNKEQPKETLLVVPRMEKERKKELYNIEEW